MFAMNLFLYAADILISLKRTHVYGFCVVIALILTGALWELGSPSLPNNLLLPHTIFYTSVRSSKSCLAALIAKLHCR